MPLSPSYQTITETVLRQLEAGTKPWQRPWACKSRSPIPLRVTGQPYRGINTLMLWIDAHIKGFSENTWMTYRQAVQIGGQVRKGEKGTLVVKYGTFASKDEQTGERNEEKQLAYLKGYTVFNVDQIDDLPPQFYTPEVEPPSPDFRELEIAESFATNTGAIIKHSGDRAFYRPSTDEIVTPPKEHFYSQVGYYSVLFHELGHWTGAKHRLDRDLKPRFDKQSYAMEELVAELTASFVCGSLGLAHDPADNTADYIASWIAVLKSDNKAIFTAAARAQEAADFQRCCMDPQSTDIGCSLSS